MKLVITAALALGVANAFTIDKQQAQGTFLRSKRSGREDIVDLATVDANTGAGQKFWANLERECVEEQCGLEEAIETFEEFGAQAGINTINAEQQKYDKYVNEYVSNYLDDNNKRDSLDAAFNKFYVDCYEKVWKDADDKKNAPGLTDLTFISATDNGSNQNGFKIRNQKGSIIEKMDKCIKSKDSSKSVTKFLSELFNIWMYEHVDK